MIHESGTRKSLSDPCEILLRASYRELGAFMSAVASDFGHDVALKAAFYWIECLESANVFPHFQEADPFRRITYEAADRLACDVVKSHMSC